MTEQKILSMEARWNIDDHNYVAIAIRNRILPTLLSGIIGDALGVPVEFKNRGSFNITTMQGYGTYNQPIGTWSDDTSLTLCLMETLVEEGTPDDLMKNLFVTKKKVI